MLVSYLNLRGAIGLFAMLLPVVVFSVGVSLGQPMRTSISSYYHYAPTRDIFVAILCAIGVFLSCYSGYSRGNWYRNELWIHKVMGVTAALVGLCPTRQAGITQGPYLEFLAHVHVFSAASLMIAMAVTAFWMFPINQDATKLSAEPARDRAIKRRNALIYRGCGLWIAAVLVYFGVHTALADRSTNDNTLFFVEWLAIWGFGVAWLLKSHWLSSITASIAERLAPTA